MKLNNFYKGAIIASVLAATIPIACKEDLDKNNPSYLTLNTYFKNANELAQGTNSIYSVLHGGGLVAREWFFLHDLRSDEVASGGGQLEVPRNQLLIGAASSGNAVMNSVWNNLFTMVSRANTVIGNAAGVTDNATLRDRLVGEAKFLRAWAYFELVSMWGPVPLYTKPVATVTEFQSRAAEAEVYKLIIQDLTEAAGVLPPSYSGGDLGRATKGAANALLGRVNLQNGDYAAAKTALMAVVSSSLYGLMDNYEDNFRHTSEFNKESIFEAAFIDKGDNAFDWGYTGNGATNAQATVRNQEYCPVAWRNLIPSDKYLNEFETEATGAAKTDPRYKMSVYETGDKYGPGNSQTLTDANQNGNSSIVNGVTKKISWRKYMHLYDQTFDQAQFHPADINQRLIRYADVLLMLAECENETNNIPGAVGYLNQVRARPSVAMPAYPTAQFPVGTKNQVTKAIMHERMIELGDEQLRNIDIIRWRKKGYYPSVTPEPLSYFRANHDELLPIPQQEIDNNPNLASGSILAQNPGY